MRSKRKFQDKFTNVMLLKSSTDRSIVVLMPDAVPCYGLASNIFADLHVLQLKLCLQLMKVKFVFLKWLTHYNCKHAFDLRVCPPHYHY